MEEKWKGRDGGWEGVAKGWRERESEEEGRQRREKRREGERGYAVSITANALSIPLSILLNKCHNQTCHTIKLFAKSIFYTPNKLLYFLAISCAKLPKIVNIWFFCIIEWINLMKFCKVNLTWS